MRINHYKISSFLTIGMMVALGLSYFYPTPMFILAALLAALWLINFIMALFEKR